ncbi:unnamed protein product [Caenorhabditis brenneri]
MWTPDRLAELYESATTSKRLPNGFIKSNKELDKVIRYGELFEACHSVNSIEYIQRAEDLDEEEKKQLIDVTTQKLAETPKQENPIPWNVNIVIGNSHVAKSLRPVINIKMPTIEGENFEFDIDSFAQFRKQLAEAVLAVNPQE